MIWEKEKEVIDSCDTMLKKMKNPRLINTSHVIVAERLL
jgi:hypothetical protein